MGLAPMTLSGQPGTGLRKCPVDRPGVGSAGQSGRRLARPVGVRGHRPATLVSRRLRAGAGGSSGNLQISPGPGRHMLEDSAVSACQGGSPRICVFEVNLMLFLAAALNNEPDTVQPSLFSRPAKNRWGGAESAPTHPVCV